MENATPLGGWFHTFPCITLLTPHAASTAGAGMVLKSRVIYSSSKRKDKSLSILSGENRRPYITTTSAPASDDQVDDHEESSLGNNSDGAQEENTDEENRTPEEESSSVDEKSPEDPVVSRLITTAVSASDRPPSIPQSTSSPVVTEDNREQPTNGELDNTRPDHLPDIASLFTDSPAPQARKENVFEGLQTREVHRSSLRSSTDMKVEHRESPDYIEPQLETESPNNGLEDAHTVGPYDSVQDYYVNDQPEPAAEPSMMKDQDDDSSTILPDAEPAYRYNIKVRTNGKVLDPPSK
ncbi:uncharacterized protein LOC144476532 [Augochlora pura]